MDIANMNWAAVVLGTILAFGLGMIWFSPMLFGKAWSTGSHDIQPPAKPPLAAMGLMLAGTFLLAFVVGMTETDEAIGTAAAAILAVAVTVAAMDLFSQKSAAATWIDAGYIVAGGVLMILAQAVL